MRLPGSRRLRRARPRRPILPSLDPTSPQTLLSPPPRPHSGAAPIGTRYAQPVPARFRVPSPPAPTNLLPESSSFPLRSAASGEHKTPASSTLRNPHSTVKPLKLSNLLYRMKMLNPPSSQTDRARQGSEIAQAPDRVGTSSACATGPLPQRGLQFSCATGLTNDSREGVVLRPSQRARRPCRGFHRVGRRDNNRATFRSLRHAPSRTGKIPLLSSCFAQPGVRRVGYASARRRRSRLSPARERRLTHSHGRPPPRRP